MNSYGVNNVIRLSVQFVELIGSAPIDPTTITLYVKSPDQTIAEYTYAGSQIVRDGVGAYHYDLAIEEVGYYNFRYEGAGDIIASSNGQFQSIASPFGSL